MKRTEKTPKRGRSRRRKRAGNYPLQLAIAISGVALVAWIVVSIVGKVVHPYWLGYDYGAKVATLRSDLVERRARNAELRSRIQHLLTEEGAETAARRAGWQRPGEKVFFLKQAPAKPADASGDTHGR